jgi:hypothetical protein
MLLHLKILVTLDLLVFGCSFDPKFQGLFGKEDIFKQEGW